jgi:hypothetical protein
MTTRRSVHALVDELAEDELEMAMRALAEIRAGGFELTTEDRDELSVRVAECDAGDVVDARAFLAALREEGSDSRR